MAIEGAVTVQATINVDGDVATATVQDSLDPFLDAAAINYVLQWKYEPALVYGTPREFP
ncbi:TonB family protein, partial [candidate division TA06 bacterium]|nr:TonB family protein [candidate division TA06 bacterium]